MTCFPATLHTGLVQHFSGAPSTRHHAAATLFEPAAETRAHQAKFIAQHIEQRCFLVVE